ncbi:MAG: hypothetical protein ABI868_02435 [Acidobacteriota bacterium]
MARRSSGTADVDRRNDPAQGRLHEHGMVAYPEYVVHGYEPKVQLVPKASSAAMARVPPGEPAQ